MASTTRWVIDSSYTSIAFTAGDLNSLASGGGALSTGTIANATNLDQYCDASFVVTVGGTTVLGGYVALFALPLNQDGSTYGDGYASSSSSVPGGNYWVASAVPKIGVTSGNTIVGTFGPFILRPRNYKLVFANLLTIALSSTAALTLEYSTYNENLNV